MNAPRSGVVVVAEGVEGRPKADWRGGRAAYNHQLIPARLERAEELRWWVWPWGS